MFVRKWKSHRMVNEWGFRLNRYSIELMLGRSIVYIDWGPRDDDED